MDLRHFITLGAAWLLVGGLASAQWSTDPTASLSLAESSANEKSPRVGAGKGGLLWVAWNVDDQVAVQVLDAEGNEQFPHGGIVISQSTNLEFTDFAVTSTGDLLLAEFIGDPTGFHRYDVTRVKPSGSLAWGPVTVAFGDANPQSFVGPVSGLRLWATNDDGFYASWRQGGTFFSALCFRFNRFVGNGQQVWQVPAQICPADLAFMENGTLVPSGTGVLNIRPEGAIIVPTAPITATKRDAAGLPLWTIAEPADTYAESIMAVPDGAGGAFIAWQGWGSQPQGTPRQVWVQHLLNDGSFAFTPGGVPVSTNLVRSRGSPRIVFDPSTSELTVMWIEQNAAATKEGLWAQRIDAAGNTLWPDTGVKIDPLSTKDLEEFRLLRSGTSTFVFWGRDTTSGSEGLFGARIDRTGFIDLPTFTVAAQADLKDFQSLAGSLVGEAILVWGGATSSPVTNAIYAQNVACDGILGPLVPGAAFTDLGQGLAGTTGVPTLAGNGCLCPTTQGSLTLSNALPGVPTILVLGLSQLSAPIKGGILVPAPDVIAPGLPTDSSGGFSLNLPVPAAAATGLALYWQVWLPDPLGPAGYSASNGLRSTLP